MNSDHKNVQTISNIRSQCEEELNSSTQGTKFLSSNSESLVSKPNCLRHF